MGAVLRQEISPKDRKFKQRSVHYLNTNKVPPVKLKNHDLDREWQG